MWAFALIWAYIGLKMISAHCIIGIARRRIICKVLCWIADYSIGASGFTLCSTIIAIVVGVLDGDGSNGAFQILVIAIQIPNVCGRIFVREMLSTLEPS